MELGTLITQKRKEMNLTQQELADILNVSSKTISKWETNRGFPEITIIPKLAKVLGVTTDELLGAIEAQEISQPEIDTINVEERKKKLVKLIAIISLCLVGIIWFSCDFYILDIGWGLTAYLSGFNMLFDVHANTLTGFIIILSVWILFLSLLAIITCSIVDYINQKMFAFQNKYFLLTIIGSSSATIGFITGLIFDSSFSFLYLTLILAMWGFAIYNLMNLKKIKKQSL